MELLQMTLWHLKKMHNTSILNCFGNIPAHSFRRIFLLRTAIIILLFISNMSCNTQNDIRHLSNENETDKGNQYQKDKNTNNNDISNNNMQKIKHDKAAELDESKENKKDVKVVGLQGVIAPAQAKQALIRLVKDSTKFYSPTEKFRTSTVEHLSNSEMRNTKDGNTIFGDWICDLSKKRFSVIIIIGRFATKYEGVFTIKNGEWEAFFKSKQQLQDAPHIGIGGNEE